MSLPYKFQFSQGSLQAYVDCPRLFQLRYLKRLAWPALEVKAALEYERHTQSGEAFHKLIQQYFLGIPEDRLSEMAESDAQLTAWWNNFLSSRPVPDGYALHSEVSLSAPADKFRLVAKYDLVMTPPSTPLLSAIQNRMTKYEPDLEIEASGSVVIYDWKTNKKIPKRTCLESKLQTRVYPYVLARVGGANIHEWKIEPERIEMVYWFANDPAAIVKFHYNQEKFRRDDAYITRLIKEIAALEEADFPLTDHPQRCEYCIYRSLCNRGREAGSLDGMDEVLDAEPTLDHSVNFDLDFDQVAEIEF